MSSPLHALRRSVTARFLVAVILAGSVAGIGTTAAVIALVRSEDEARLVDDALDRAERATQVIDHRVSLGLAKLETVAATLGRPESLSAARHLDATFEAVRCVRGGRPLLEVGKDAETVAALAGRPLEGPRVERVDDARVLLRSTVGEVTSVALVDVTSAVAMPSGWTTELVPVGDDAVVGAHAVRERRAGQDRVRVSRASDSGIAVRLDAPLGPAQAAAMALGWRIFLWSTLGIPFLVGLGWLASRTTTRPLRRLARAVRKAGSGEVQVPSMPPDEIGEVARAVGHMSRRAHEQARILRSVVRSVRRLGLAPEPRAVLAILEDALEESVPGIRWTMASVALADTPELARALDIPPGSVGRALARESPIDPGSQYRATDLTDRPESSLETEPDGTLLVPLQTLGRDFGLVIGRHVNDRRVLPVVELLCATSVSRLRRLELGQIVAGQEKRALLGSVLSVLGQKMHSPASVLAANLHVLRAASDDDAEVLDEARTAAQALFDEVRHLSAFARNASPTSLEPIDLGLLLHRIRSHALASTPNVPVTVRAPDGLRAVGDPYQTEQGLLLLVKNAQEAVAHTPEPEVTVEGAIEGERLVVDVRDNGPGVDARVRARLFEPFASTKTREGTGLGLYLARSFARSQGGDVELRGTGPEGSVFRLTVRADRLPTRGTVRAPPRRVLLVETDPTVLARFQRWVPAGVQATAVEATREALSYVRSFQFDAVVCGIPLADSSPRDLLRSFEDLVPALRGHVVFLNAEGQGSVEPDLQCLPWPSSAQAFQLALEIAFGGVSDAA